MAKFSTQQKSATAMPRQRLSREERNRQLLDTAWQIIGQEGTENLSLGRLAEQSSVTKPVVYDHFGTRLGLLAALYQEFDARQNALFDELLQASEATLIGRATLIATAYVDCVLLQGREIPGIIAALAGTPELEKIKRAYEVAFIEKCRQMLVPFASGKQIAAAGLWAMLGAAEALSCAAVCQQISADEAKRELLITIVALVERS